LTLVQQFLGQGTLTSVTQQATLNAMKIGRIVHKGLKGLYERDSVRGVPAGAADKLRKMLAFLESMGAPEELAALPVWKAHLLTGDRDGTWSLSVTRNWRLTFRIDLAEQEIRDLNLEDYH
jgi:proteic killer suppression protein